MDREEILLRLRERIVAFAASRISRDQAEDLVQEVLIVLEQKYAEVTELDELLPLSLQIFRFKLAGYRRKAQRRGELDPVPAESAALADLGPTPEMYAERQELLDRLSRAIPNLGERCREMMRLKLLGKSFAEIQEEMGAASINTVYTWDARCRQRLLELMGGRWEKR
jgi:RNA polymerase sigma-70 factor (ECF subfamily)